MAADARAGTVEHKTPLGALRAAIVERWYRITLFWRAQIVVWSLFAVADIATRQTIYKHMTAALALTLLMTPVMMLLTAGLRWAYTRLGLDGRISVRTNVYMLGLSFVASLIAVIVSDMLRWYFDWPIPNWDRAEAWTVLVAFHYAVLLGWSLGYVWFKAEVGMRINRQRAAQAKADALRAELAKLRLQLDPHFLFNALNGIATEIPDHPKNALYMVRELSDYLRYSLDTIDETVVATGTEAMALVAYLNVQRARFGEKLVAHLMVDPAADTRPIASFLLQPLVENAIKHGSRRTVLTIDIRVETSGDDLRVAVRNSGTLTPHAHGGGRHSGGFGLVNFRRRLALHYPDRHSFTLSERDGMVAAELVLSGVPCSGS